MSTRQGLPEALETGENRCLLNLGTLTSQGNYTFMFLGWLGKERTRHWLLQNFGRTLALRHSGASTSPVFWDARYLGTNFNG